MPEEALLSVKEITLCMAEYMLKIVRHCFPKAARVIDRFHVQNLALDAIQQIRIEHPWDAKNNETDQKEKAKLLGEKYNPKPFENGETRKQVLEKVDICF